MQKKCNDCYKMIVALDNEFYSSNLCLSCGIDRRLLIVDLTGKPEANNRMIQPDNCKSCGLPIKKLLSGDICEECQTDSRFNPEI